MYFEVDTCSKIFLHLLNAVMEIDLLGIQSVEIASPVRKESEVNQLTYFNNTDLYWYITAIIRLRVQLLSPTPGCEASSP